MRSAQLAAAYRRILDQEAKTTQDDWLRGVYDAFRWIVGDSDDDPTQRESEYRSQCARDAQAANYGGKHYWDYLDETSQKSHDYYMERGNTERAELMLTRTLSEALVGNDGD